MLAWELFLHLTDPEIKGVFNIVRDNLRSGRLIFNIYATGREDSLDERFARLGFNAKMSREEVVKNGVININEVAKALKTRGLYEENKRRFWLDLDKIRVYSESEAEGWIRSSKMKIFEKQAIKGGMFSFAHRIAYAVETC